MKKNIKYVLITCILIIAMGTFTNAQKYRSSSAVHYSRVDNTDFHYGYTVGFGVFDYRITNVRYGGEFAFLAEQVNFAPALRLGVIGEWNITEFLSFRSIPGLYFGKREITYTRDPEVKINDRNTFNELGYPDTKTAEVKSVYADIPLLFKYKGNRINNYNLYLLAGCSYKMDLSPHSKLKPEKNRILRTNMHDFALEFGAGADLYFQYFKMGVELRVSIGLIDVMNHNLVKSMPDYHIYTKTIGSMKSTIVTLAFNFE